MFWRIDELFLGKKTWNIKDWKKRNSYENYISLSTSLHITHTLLEGIERLDNKLEILTDDIDTN